VHYSTKTQAARLVCAASSEARGCRIESSWPYIFPYQQLFAWACMARMQLVERGRVWLCFMHVVHAASGARPSFALRAAAVLFLFGSGARVCSRFVFVATHAALRIHGAGELHGAGLYGMS